MTHNEQERWIMLILDHLTTPQIDQHTGQTVAPIMQLTDNNTPENHDKPVVYVQALSQNFIVSRALEYVPFEYSAPLTNALDRIPTSRRAVCLAIAGACVAGLATGKIPLTLPQPVSDFFVKAHANVTVNRTSENSIYLTNQGDAQAPSQGKTN
jgi:hypothetical protein